MAEHETTLTILFADLGNSTRLYDELGDARAHEIVSGCIERISDEIVNQGGTVVKTIGDEVMSTFPSADRAAEAAAAIQRAMAPSDDDEAPRVTVHVGLHHGPVIPEGGDVFGDAVNVAARIVGLANPGQILTTHATVEEMSPGLRKRTRQIDCRPVKGKRDDLGIFEVVWDAHDLTEIFRIPVHGLQQAQRRMLLSYRGDERELSRQHPTVTIGRDPSNDIVISSARASRWHATVDLRSDKFVLCDSSTNGTLVCTPQGERILLRREEMVLPGSGSIAVGEYSEADEDLPVHFRCVP